MIFNKEKRNLLVQAEDLELASHKNKKFFKVLCDFISNFN